MGTSSFRFETDAASAEPMSEIRCPGCGDYLVVHMPDPELPERLLGTCDGCKSWYLMDTGKETMVLICGVPQRSAPRTKGRARPKGRTHEAKRAPIG